jgi:hypothetical protein
MGGGALRPCRQFSSGPRCHPVLLSPPPSGAPARLHCPACGGGAVFFKLAFASGRPCPVLRPSTFTRVRGRGYWLWRGTSSTLMAGEKSIFCGHAGPLPSGGPGRRLPGRGSNCGLGITMFGVALSALSLVTHDLPRHRPAFPTAGARGLRGATRARTRAPSPQSLARPRGGPDVRSPPLSHATEGCGKPRRRGMLGEQMAGRSVL